MRRDVVLLLAFAVLVAGCAGDNAAESPDSSPTPTSASVEGDRPTEPSSSDRPSPERAPETDTTKKQARLRGIDASHHQGAIDWKAVAGDGISFAYLKATEGTTFTDPTFAGHRAAAQRQGIRVGGYHYFQLCSDGEAQAEHFARVLGDNGGRRGLAPAVDLELAGSCAVPPDREALLAEVRAFLARIERAYGARPLVYLYPDFEERFGLASDLSSYPQWVRRLGRTPPQRTWHLWQYDDRGSVPGIAGGVDLNLMRPADAAGGIPTAGRR